MKALLFRATAPAVTLASCLVMFGGVANAQSADISDTGRDSHNSIKFENLCVFKVHNNTHINVSNNNSQSATSGDADVHNNDDVGSVTTGDASNSNESNFNLSVVNESAGCGGTINEEQPPAGGQGGGGETVVPAAAPVATTGGRGGEVATVPVAQQVAVVPVGGVGAGEGTPAYLAGLTAVTLASGALAIRRSHKSFKNLF